MKQYELINNLIDVFVKNNLIDCAFLMGSFGRKKEDDYSNIDLYLQLNINYEEKFFKLYYPIIESYRPVIYFENKNNQILNIIYNDDLNLIIHLTDLKNLKIDNDILKLYDPNNLLDDILNYSLQDSFKEIGELINSISYESFNFIRFSLRFDLPIMLDITCGILKKYSNVLRYYKDPNSSKLNQKEILSVLSFDERKRYVEILSALKIDSLKECLKMILNDLTDVIGKLDINIAKYYDYDFLMYVKRKISIL